MSGVNYVYILTYWLKCSHFVSVKPKALVHGYRSAKDCLEVVMSAFMLKALRPSLRSLFSLFPPTWPQSACLLFHSLSCPPPLYPVWETCSGDTEQNKALSQWPYIPSGFFLLWTQPVCMLRDSFEWVAIMLLSPGALSVPSTELWTVELLELFKWSLLVWDNCRFTCIFKK